MCVSICNQNMRDSAVGVRSVISETDFSLAWHESRFVRVCALAMHLMAIADRTARYLNCASYEDAPLRTHDQLPDMSTSDIRWNGRADRHYTRAQAARSASRRRTRWTAPSWAPAPASSSRPSSTPVVICWPAGWAPAPAPTRTPKSSSASPSGWASKFTPSPSPSPPPRLHVSASRPSTGLAAAAVCLTVSVQSGEPAKPDGRDGIGRLVHVDVLAGWLGSAASSLWVKVHSSRKACFVRRSSGRCCVPC